MDGDKDNPTTALYARRLTHRQCADGLALLGSCTSHWLVGALSHGNAEFRALPRTASFPSAPAAGAAEGRQRPGTHDFSRARSLRTLTNFCPEHAPAAQQRALAFAECVVCFDDLYIEAAGVFTKSGSRVCPHFLHYRCAEDIRLACRSGAVCPICRCVV